MPCLFRTLCSIGLTLAAAPLLAQEYSLKSKVEAQGDVNRVSTANSFHMDVFAENEGKAVKISELKSTETMAFVETILAKKPGEKATQLRREYTAAVLDQGDGKKKTLAFHGKKLLIERNEGGYEFRFEGGDLLEGESVDFLKNEFQMSDDLADPDTLLRPKKPVKVGETWVLDMAPIAKNYARTTPVPLDQAKARGQGKLVKVYPKDGREFALIEVEIEIPLKAGPQGAMTVMEGSKLTLKQKIDGAFDGKFGTQVFESHMNLDIEGLLDAGKGKMVKTTMTGKGTFRAEVTDLSQEAK